MEELISSLFEYIQYLVLGAIMVLLLMYAMATIHPLRAWLRDYAIEIARPWVPKINNTLITHIVSIALLIGFLYYLGVAAIAASYAFVEPLRIATLDCIYQPTARRCGSIGAYGNSASEVSLGRALILPVIGHFEHTNRASNGRYLKDEAKVDDAGSKNLEGVLDSEVTFARITRATVFASFCTAAVSILKILLVFFTSLFWLSKSNLLYGGLIDEKEKWISNGREYKNGDYSKTDKLTVAFRRVIVPQVLILLLSLGLYILSIIAYRATEFEYSTLVKDSAGFVQSCAAAVGTVSP